MKESIIANIPKIGRCTLTREKYLGEYWQWTAQTKWGIIVKGDFSHDNDKAFENLLKQLKIKLKI